MYAKKRIFTFIAKKEFIYLQLIKQLSVSYFVKGESFMFKKYITTVILITVFFVSTKISAQCPPGQRPNPVGRCVPVGPGVPIDGGIALLLAVGVAFGIKKFRE